MRLFYSAEYRNASAELWLGNANSLLSEIPSGSVDLVITSPPYFMGKEYDSSTSVTDFVEEHRRILPLVARVLKPGGSVCWQVGHHVRSGREVPLDALVFAAAQQVQELVLRNRIVWTFGHGVHCSRRFSGRHETVLWFTKGENYHFNLDAVRVPQKYPGKRYYRGPKKGMFSGNPKGKNPGDVWDIPNVKARHAEKTEHPCQFPVALVQRFVRALTRRGDRVVDPYLGSGSSAVAALIDRRDFIGCDVEPKYLKIAKSRIERLVAGTLETRPDVPARTPVQGEAVSVRPQHFASFAEVIS